MDRYVVVGHPVAHSLSPQIHSLFAEQTGQTIAYERLEAPLDGFAETLDDFFAAGGRGCNVTLPFKGDAARWVSTLTADAAFAQAVNTVVPTAAGPTVGHNTDGPGLVRDLDRTLSGARRLKVLLIGAGGAARGVARPLLNSLAGELVIANRTPARAEALARALLDDAPPASGAPVSSAPQDCQVSAASFADLSGHFDLVINATSAGLTDEVPMIPAAVVRNAVCYDMVYGGTTAFCRWSREAGARAAVDGLGMLVEQAALAFELWRGVAPDSTRVLAQLRREQAEAGPKQG